MTDHDAAYVRMGSYVRTRSWVAPLVRVGSRCAAPAPEPRAARVRLVSRARRWAFDPWVGSTPLSRRPTGWWKTGLVAQV